MRSAAAVLGTGAWGTALANVIARARPGERVVLWGRDPARVARLAEMRENTDHLPGVPLEDGVAPTTDLGSLALAPAVLVVTPAQATRASLEALAHALTPGQPLVMCSKGIERASGAFQSEVAAEAAPGHPVCVLSGPSFAADVATGKPVAVTLACANDAPTQTLLDLFRIPTFRVYLTDDLLGAQIGGALKNVLAIACGIVDGKGLGESARAALISRGFAEMVRLGLNIGARVETLSGLSGLGDLVLTCSSAQSRNCSLGMELGQGRPLDQILKARASVTEGVASAQPVLAMARERNLEMPISEAVARITAGAVTVDEAILDLLSRPLKTEADRPI